MLEWVEVEPINGARTWILCLNGEPIAADDVVDDLDWLGDD